ncbi:hypothetical protein DFH07DRAFT_951769 [Mycena maculata]|uniref:Cupin type-1 domain-containing protein n=1 Tax=Mycena maculata TaxID=230809 RepID=A0AAD7K230_9AGAR|nr:hypothetical protein DFH07DRAFT_951769 [Mycena maculata]
MFSFTSALVLASALGSTLAAETPAPNNTQLVSELKTAATAVDRVNLLSNDSRFVFNFFDPAAGATKGAGGEIVLANAASFPAVIGNGIAMVQRERGTGMITENGARFIMTNLSPGEMTIFPQGSVHFQITEGCEPALFVSGLNSEDPGALQIAQRCNFGLSPDIVAATLGDIGLEEVLGLEDIIPDNVAIGTDECLKRCNITRPTQPTTQLQPTVSGNAFPSSVTAYAWPKASSA